ASLVVELYAKKQDSAGNPVGETKELAKIRRERLDLEKQLGAVEERVRSNCHVQKEYNLLRDWISRETLPKAVMEELTKAEVYEAKDTPFDKIEEITSNRVTLAEVPKVVEVDEDEDILRGCVICDEENCNKELCKTVFEYDYDRDEPPRTGLALMFGKTQAGKSTFIGFVKNYAISNCHIDNNRIGTEFRSKTGMPEEFVVKSNLPIYEVFDSSGIRIDIATLGNQYQNPDDYYALNDRSTRLTFNPRYSRARPPREYDITFWIPGIEDTDGKDVKHAPKIIEAMARIQALNLIIVVISCVETPSVSHQLAFNYYSKVIHTFQGNHSNIVFVYTHVDYKKCHHSNTDHFSVMELRHRAFSQLFRCQGSYSHDDISKATIESYPMYNIDCDKRQRPSHNACDS
ncbi:hypothetical protein BG000_004857, partial [Podila horticola]